MRSSIARINWSWGIDSKHESTSVSTNHRRPRQASSMRTWRASCTLRLGPNPARPRQEVAFEDRFDRRLQSRLHDAVTHARDRERTLLVRTGLGDPHPAGWQRPVLSSLEVRGQFVEQPGHPLVLDVGDGRWSMPAAPRLRRTAPGALQHVPAMDLVIEVRGTIARGRPWPPGKAFAAGLGPCLAWRGQSRGHSPALSCTGTHRRSSGPSSPAVVLSARLKQYYGASDAHPARHPPPAGLPPAGADELVVVSSTRRHHLQLAGHTEERG